MLGQAAHPWFGTLVFLTTISRNTISHPPTLLAHFFLSFPCLSRDPQTGGADRQSALPSGGQAYRAGRRVQQGKPVEPVRRGGRPRRYGAEPDVFRTDGAESCRGPQGLGLGQQAPTYFDNGKKNLVLPPDVFLFLWHTPCDTWS